MRINSGATKARCRPFMLMSGPGLGCVITRLSLECAELFSLLASPDSGRQRYWFSNRRNRDGISTRKFCVGVFTQPGSISEVGGPNLEVRFALVSGHRQPGRSGPKGAMNGLMHRSKEHCFSITS
jgi:hypothetical protein